MSEPTAPNAEYDLVVNGVTLHYATWGRFTEQERTVILVHGITSNHMNWTLLAPALAEAGFYVIALDLRGRGLSSKPEHGYGVPFHANDILALCDKLGLQRVHIIGHSLGAIITLYLAALYPQRVGKITLVDGGDALRDDTLATISSSLSRLGVTYSSLDAYLNARRTAFAGAWNDFWDQYYRYDAETLPDGTVVSRVPRTAIEEELAALAALDVETLPPLTHATTLITYAGQGTLAADRGFILPEAAARRIHEQIAGSRVVQIPDVNHYTIIQAETLIHETVAFLREQQ